jgi:hypothetical protein
MRKKRMSVECSCNACIAVGDAWKCGEGNRQATPKASTSRAGSITIESPQSTNVCRGSRNRELLFNGHGSGIAIGSGYPLRHA